MHVISYRMPYVWSWTGTCIFHLTEDMKRILLSSGKEVILISLLLLNGTKLNSSSFASPLRSCSGQLRLICVSEMRQMNRSFLPPSSRDFQLRVIDSFLLLRFYTSSFGRIDVHFRNLTNRMSFVTRTTFTLGTEDK